MLSDPCPDRPTAPSPARSVAIIGAGMAGLSCADALVADGHRVVLCDKGRGPGGRMSTRRVATPLGEAGFDHGAQYFTVRDPAFAAVVEHWADLGCAAPWPAAGPGAWVGMPAMNAPVRTMAAAHAVCWGARVDGLVRTPAGWHLHGDGLPDDRFDQVVVALPAEQAAALLDPVDVAMARKARSTPSAPCWTTMLALGEPLATVPPVLRDRGAIGWAARNASKPGRTGPETWVIQAGPDWSREHLEADAAWVTTTLLEALAQALGTPIPHPVHAASHRWRYARSGALGPGFLRDPAGAVAVCGDWLLGPRVECAWRSGFLLGRQLAADWAEARS